MNEEQISIIIERLSRQFEVDGVPCTPTSCVTVQQGVPGC